MNKTYTKSKPVSIILKRELLSFFTNPAAYIVIGLFLTTSGIIFFSTFFLGRRATLRPFFNLLPILFSLFIPAITMRLFAEEKRSGSIETLLTLPVTETTVVLGKFFGALIASFAMLFPTVFYVITAACFSRIDAGPIIGGYIGAVFLMSVYCAIGIFASSITKNQIVAFFTAFAISAFLTLVGVFMIFMPSSIVQFFTFLSITTHFNSIARGIIDSRDIIYFASITILFLILTIKSEQKAWR